MSNNNNEILKWPAIHLHINTNIYEHTDMSKCTVTRAKLLLYCIHFPKSCKCPQFDP